MGRASHKLAGSYLSLNTALAQDEILQMCTDIAEQVYKRRADKPGSIRLDHRGGLTCKFSVLGGFKKVIMRFEITARPTAAGGCDLVSRISYFTTLQSTMLGFIPIGPKKLNGWPSYNTFMISVQDAIRAVDPAADAAIVQEAG